MVFNKLDDSAVGKIRPRFKLQSPEDMKKIISLIENEGKNDGSVILKKQQGKFLKISIPKNEQHYWSPVLNLSFYDKEEPGRTIIRGQIGPSESVWGLFILFYAAIAILGFFGAIWAYVQWALHENTNYFIIIPIALAILLSIFSTSRFGQRKAHLQTLHIMRFLRKSIDSIECNRLI